MGAYADLLQEMADLVEAVSGLTRIKLPGDGTEIPAQAMNGGFVVRFTSGSDTDLERGRATVRDEHECAIHLWYLADHRDQLTTEKTALDDVIAIRNALYPTGRSLTGATPTGFSWDLSTEAGGEVLRVTVSTTLQHSTTVS